MQTEGMPIVPRLIFFLVVTLLMTAISACSPSNFENRDIDLSVPTTPDIYGEKSLHENINATPFTLPGDYFISPGDLLEIKFPYRPELNDQYLVRTDGRISLLFLGSLFVAGKTPEELQETINDSYRKFSSEGNNDSVVKEYRIQVGDLLAIKLANSSELDTVVVVRPDGKISLPLVGTIIAENVSPERLEEQLSIKYGDHVRNPELVVMVQEFSSNSYYVNGVPVHNKLKGLEDAVVIVRDSAPMKIFVGGEVGKPGFLPYTGRVTALQAIIMAGGDTLSADMRQVAVIRKGGGGKPTLFIRNLKSDVSVNDEGRLYIEDAALGDIFLRPYDVLIVPKKNIAKITDYVDQYLYTLIPALRNISFSFVYDLNPVDTIKTKE